MRARASHENAPQRGGLPFRKNAASSVFGDYAKPNVAGTDRQQLPGHVRVLGDKAYDFSVGYLEKPVESRVMLLHARVTQIVARSARKHRQMHRPIKFKGSAATPRTEQTQASAASASSHGSEREPKPATARSIGRFDNVAILYDNTQDYVRPSSHGFSPRRVRPLCLKLCPPPAATVPHEVIRRVSGTLRRERQVQEITGDDSKEIGSATGNRTRV